MKYYIYISDAQVDVLFSQLRGALKKRVTVGSKIDTNLFGAWESAETKTEESRIARLETVLEYIRGSGEVGTVDEPNEYFEGSLEMKWSDCILDRSFLAYFGAETKQTILGLGGPVRNLIGNTTGAAFPMSVSTPAVLHFLSVYLDTQKNDLAHTSVMDAPEELRYSTRHALRSIYGPNQQLEFFARRLAYWPAKTKPPGESDFPNVLVGTPLYVAMATDRTSFF
ncbi:SAVMC3_10250 family protein [Acidobacterium sp. S8]|uniref:DUF7019 family protein n=1 Tax=Acidobacterium sp. S8 TaxID=1641854 RepID=UPI00131A8E00|nr:SAVMC3_10250 family protein [Acidobacterium sp. S8]